MLKLLEAVWRIYASVDQAIVSSDNELELVFCKVDPWEQISVKFESKYQMFHNRDGRHFSLV